MFLPMIFTMILPVMFPPRVRRSRLSAVFVAALAAGGLSLPSPAPAQMQEQPPKQGVTPPKGPKSDKPGGSPPAKIKPFESLSTILRAVVGIRAKIPANASTVKFLGTERTGSGVVIDSTGLILTIGYLILEANDIEIIRPGGKKVPGRIVGYDNASGLALLRATQPLNLKPVKFGSSDSLEPGNPVMIVSHAGMPPVSAAQVVSRRPYAGYWEYVLDKAIFTSPPHAEYTGAALFGEDGHLHGIGNTFVHDTIAPGMQLPGNVFVPVGTLKSVMVDLLEQGRPSGPARPWLGFHLSESGGRLLVLRIADNGPAAQAGIKPGDFILGINGEAIKTLEGLYKKVWSLGPAGTPIPVDVVTEKHKDINVRRVDVRSQSRYDWLKIDKR
ncbi:MAG: S1C family serine protease [Rhodospirillales bacterium]